MILVAGGTGRLGTMVVQELLRRDHPVRVLTRNAERARALEADGAALSVGDVRDPSCLPAAMAGVHTVISAVHGFTGPGRVTPSTVDRDGNANLVHAARTVGADVVLMSVVGASPDHPIELFRMKAAAENVLRSSGVPYTIVRAAAFLELWQELLSKGPRPVVFGRGENPINFVAVAHVADAVIRAAEQRCVRGRTVEVVGPRDLTLNQLAAQVRPHDKPLHVSPLVLRVLSGFAPATVRRQAATALAMDTCPLQAVSPRPGQAGASPKPRTAHQRPAR